MWHKPQLMNTVANLLFALGGMIAFYEVVFAVIHLPVFPLREIRVNGELQHVTREQVQGIVRQELKGNFFTLDLNQARHAFEKLPWVRSSNVRRYWPDRIEVTLNEHQPLARWGDLSLVNTHGELFNAAYDGALPVFVGPSGSEKEMSLGYEKFTRMLASIKHTPRQVRLSARRAWELRLDNGLTIELGREQVDARLEKFVTVYDRTIGKLQRKIDYADLRYPNGFAVRIPEYKVAEGGRKG